MKKEFERRADILGFKCYYDISTGDMRSAGSSYMDLLFSIVLVLNWGYRQFMFKVFRIIVFLNMEIHPDEGEERREMYLKMESFLQKADEEE